MSQAVSGVASSESHDPANGLGGAKDRLAIEKPRPAIERAGEAIAENFLGDDRRSVGHRQKDQQLKEQKRLHAESSRVQAPAARLSAERQK